MILLIFFSAINFSDEIKFPRDMPVTFGSGEAGEDFRFDKVEAGDILHGVEDSVPPVRSIWKRLQVGAMVPDVRVWNNRLGEHETVRGTHWGFGVVLLDRDAARIRRLLRIDLATEEQKLSPLTLGALLRGFFPGRSYVRLYSLGGSQGSRLNKSPFLFYRLEAIQRKF
jgi:hypothetical protein